MLSIFGNLLLQVVDGTLLLIGIDFEMEMVVRVVLVQLYELGVMIVLVCKFFDICCGLFEGVEIVVQLEGERMLVCFGCSRFLLFILLVVDFSNFDDWQSEVEFILLQVTMKCLIEVIQFFMVYQDVCYYLNGMLFEIEGEELCIVVIDGYCLVVCLMLIG